MRPPVASNCRQHRRKCRRVHTRLDADPNLANLDLDTATALAAGRCHLRGICMRRHRQTRWIDPYRHEPWHLDTNRPRHLAPPHRQQPAHHSVSPRDLGYVRAFFETLGDNPRLLLGRPPAPPTLPCDQFDPAIPPSSCLASSMAFAIAHLQRSAYARLYCRRFTRGLDAALMPVTA